jgi:hypothetical protein
VAQWEYCQISKPQSGTDAVRFSNQQPDTIIAEFSSELGRGLKPQSSHSGELHLNLNHTTTIVVAGLLGKRGWELVSHALLSGNHESWTFKRPYGWTPTE